MKIGLAEAAAHLAASGKEFAEVLQTGSLVVELYRPHEVDKQTPHDRDELYVITSGTSVFLLEGTRTSVSTGDVLFVPAGAEHHFVAFSEDFCTWVFFYGPPGGEKGAIRKQI